MPKYENDVIKAVGQLHNHLYMNNRCICKYSLIVSAFITKMNNASPSYISVVEFRSVITYAKQKE